VHQTKVSEKLFKSGTDIVILFGQDLERTHHSTENVLDLAFCQSMRPSSLNSGVYVLNTG
jgi:hypothetical protein